MPQAAYDEIADWYETEFLAHQRWGSEEREFADAIGIDQALVELLGPGRGTCLEVGCGTGVYADRVSRLGRNPIGAPTCRPACCATLLLDYRWPGATRFGSRSAPRPSTPSSGS